MPRFDVSQTLSSQSEQAQSDISCPDAMLVRKILEAMVQLKAKDDAGDFCFQHPQSSIQGPRLEFNITDSSWELFNQFLNFDTRSRELLPLDNPPTELASFYSQRESIHQWFHGNCDLEFDLDRNWLRIRLEIFSPFHSKLEVSITDYLYKELKHVHDTLAGDYIVETDYGIDAWTGRSMTYVDNCIYCYAKGSNDDERVFPCIAVEIGLPYLEAKERAQRLMRLGRGSTRCVVCLNTECRWQKYKIDNAPRPPSRVPLQIWFGVQENERGQWMAVLVADQPDLRAKVRSAPNARFVFDPKDLDGPSQDDTEHEKGPKVEISYRRLLEIVDETWKECLDDMEKNDYGNKGNTGPNSQANTCKKRGPSKGELLDVIKRRKFEIE
ncbi:uncharacterized protein F4807DRAFT_461051 [Annulohypoxylon truncatum]|uniref:uncharacterized protein n=1 Tax=Annulohypoxylon truncatum TaxID=327061 RepID=UPI002008D21F|nr:uncharacterized protein F4807DRAFT_461051 [Annulohypoxylon truncatum]KAI1208929.1 hypothetical protein F4807DRAFT_461051 [Annulohypoxylon truncatum]